MVPLGGRGPFPRRRIGARVVSDPFAAGASREGVFMLVVAPVAVGWGTGNGTARRVRFSSAMARIFAAIAVVSEARAGIVRAAVRLACPPTIHRAIHRVGRGPSGGWSLIPRPPVPTDRMPADRMPADRMPADRMPADRMPADRVPADRVRADGVPRRAGRAVSGAAMTQAGATPGAEGTGAECPQADRPPPRNATATRPARTANGRLGVADAVPGKLNTLRT
jgi:hypothetical protein